MQKNKKTKPQAEENIKTSKVRNYFWIGVIFLLFVAIGAIIFFWQLMQKPVSSVAHVVEAPVVEDKKISFERFEGKHFSFHHTADYSIKSHQDVPDANQVILETAFLASSEVNSKKIAMTVENLSGRKMTDSTNYNLRKVFVDKYREEKFSVGEISGVAFTAIAIDTYEKVIFIPHENYLAEIALTGPAVTDGSMDAELEDVVRSIQWKQE